jgi:hypothetical protein
MTVERTNARIIGYASANYTGWQKLAGLTSHWARILEQLEIPGPWILNTYAGSTSPVGPRSGTMSEAPPWGYVPQET